MSSLEVVEAKAVPAPPATGEVGMRVTVSDLSALALALGIVKLGTLGKVVLPALGHIRLEATGTRLRLTATSLTYGVTVDVPATVEAEGVTTVPARLFVDFVNTLPRDCPLSLEYNLRSKQVLVTSGRDKARIKSLGAEDFPVVRTMDDITGALAIPAGDIRKGIKRTLFAASADSYRPLLTCVRWRFLPDQRMEWAATDGYRASLATFHLDHGLPTTTGAWLIPASTMLVLAEIVKDAAGDEPVHVQLSPLEMGRPRLLLRCGTRQMDVTLDDGNFPAVESIVPKSWTTRITVDRSLLRQGTRLAEFLSSKDTNMIRLVTDSVEQTLTVSGKSVEFGDSLTRIAVVMDGEETQIAFSARYLKDVLSAIEGDVVIETTRSGAPTAFRPHGDETWVHAIMPMNMS